MNRTYETPNIHLAAAILSCVAESTIQAVDAKPTVNDRRVITVEYPEDQKLRVQDIAEKFRYKALEVNLYEYNQALASLKKILFGDRKKSVRGGNGKPQVA